MAKAYKKRSLGRGLSSILNDDENNILDQKKNKLFNEIQIDLIDLNPFQPRTNFNSDELEQLTSSIEKLGLIQPITVKKNENRYTLISGERRLRECEVKIDCLEYAIRTNQDSGVWGGTTEDERKSIRREYKKTGTLVNS